MDKLNKQIKFPSKQQLKFPNEQKLPEFPFKQWEPPKKQHKLCQIKHKKFMSQLNAPISEDKIEYMYENFDPHSQRYIVAMFNESKMTTYQSMKKNLNKLVVNLYLPMYNKDGEQVTFYTKKDDNFIVSLNMLCYTISQFIRWNNNMKQCYYKIRKNGLVQWEAKKVEGKGFSVGDIFIRVLTRVYANDGTYTNEESFRPLVSLLFPKQMYQSTYRRQQMMLQYLTYQDVKFCKEIDDPNVLNLYEGFIPDQLDVNLRKKKLTQPAHYNDEHMLSIGKYVYDVLYNHIWYICKGQESQDEQRRHQIADMFMKYITWVVQNPDKPSGKIFLIEGVPGLGKSSLIQWIGRNIIGSILDDTEVRDKYNGVYIGKKILLFEEVMQTRNVANWLKQMATGEDMTFRPMYQEPVSSKNISVMFCCTQSARGILIEQGDRRYVLMGRFDIKANAAFQWCKKNLVEPLRMEEKYITRYYGQCAALYMSKYELNGWRPSDPNCIPYNDPIKQSHINSCRPIYEDISLFANAYMYHYNCGYLKAREIMNIIQQHYTNYTGRELKYHAKRGNTTVNSNYLAQLMSREYKYMFNKIQGNINTYSAIELRQNQNPYYGLFQKELNSLNLYKQC